GSGEDRGATEAMTNQDRWRLPRLPQMIGSEHKIGNVRRECRIGKIAFAGAEPGEVEAQHRNAPCGECRSDALGRQHVLAAGEAMREQRIGRDRAVRQIQGGGELMAACARKLKTFSRHRFPPYEWSAF